MKIRDNILAARASFFKLNWIRLALAGATVVLGVLYIWQVNETATRGFDMRDLESDIIALERENDRLQMEVARLQSTGSVTTRMKMLGLVKVGSIEYVTPGSDSVAINR